ncbi:MAG TPA: hypothetical protein VM165_01460 [Planctomycetaceae bacterium]|nr:hypothetical protein [Planctomycetaceae bacterium]
METTLHRQLKALYAGPNADCEVRVDGYRIDAVVSGRLIEIQQASLSALRTKVRALLDGGHRVLVVKPLAANKLIIRRDPESHCVLSQRRSPQHESVWDLFLDLVHFSDVFPHPRLTLEVVLVDIDEYRHERPSKRRSRHSVRVQDRILRQLGERHRFRTAADLVKLLPSGLSDEFTTAELATALGLPRWWAQKVAYCLRKMNAVETIGKRRRAWLYALPKRRAA